MLGLEQCGRTKKFVALSPFDYERNCLLYIPKDISDGRSGTEAEYLARRIEELIELIRRRERSQGSRSTNENNRLIYNQLLSSLGKALCCEIAEAYFFNHPIQPLKQDRKDRIFQSFIFSLSQNFRTHHSVSFYAAEQCLTPRYFSTIVREKSGRNALQWIMMFIIAEAKKLLDRVGLPEDPDTKVMDIGVGKQQLVEIAKALSKDVKLLILDEPTAALNDEDSAHLLDLVRQLRDEQGVTSIIITHKLNEVAAIADNVTIIRDGSTVGVMYVTPETPLDQEELIRKMVGRPLHNLYPNHPSNTPGEEYLRVEDWTVHHPLDAERVIVDHANINVHAGEIVGLAGLMGAGRTEMAMSIFGHSYGSNISGKVFVKGKEVKMPNVQSAIDAGLAYATEDRKGNGLNLLQNIRENASLASLTKISKGGVVDDNLERKEVEQYRKDFNIKCHDIDVNVSTLSGGNQQKVLLAKWVISQPDILILDEPTRGIDVGAKYEIYEIIDKLADAGKAVIVISSELPELIGICDRIYTVSYGVVTDNVEKNGFTQEYLMKGMTKEREVAA